MLSYVIMKLSQHTNQGICLIGLVVLNDPLEGYIMIHFLGDGRWI